MGMRVECYGQSAFRLAVAGATVFLDPFADVSGLARRGLESSSRPMRSKRMEHVHALGSPAFDTGELPADGRPLAVVPAAP